LESIKGQEGLIMADPCAEEQMMFNNKKISEVGKNNWLFKIKQNCMTTR
jgi:hypothetical protein